MAHSGVLSALRAPRAPPVQLPLFLVPFFARNAAPPLQSCHGPRGYANHAKMPKVMPKNKRDPLVDPNASRKHLKADFPLTTKQSNRDMNRKRGVSAIRSTGPRQRLSVAKYPLPVPVTDPEQLKAKRNAPEFNDERSLKNHGLWGFFYEDKKAMVPPEKMGEHGREWTYTELTLKSFEDLHALYWVAHKERNRITTNWAERNRVHAGYGGSEDETRRNTVEQTMKNIRDVLRDRYESVEEAARIVDSTPLSTLDLEEKLDTYTEAEYVPEAELAQMYPETLPAEDASPPRESFQAHESLPNLRY